MPGVVTGRSAFTRRGVRSTGLVSIATRSGMHKQGEQPLAEAGHTAHHRVEVVADTATDLIARYGWWSWMDNPLPAGSLRLSACFVAADNSIVPITFNNGQSTLTATFDGSSTFYTDSDVIAVTVTRGQVVAIRSFLIGVSGAEKYGTTWYSGTDTLSWYQVGDHLADDPASPPAAPGPEYNNDYYCSPIALLGVQS